LIKVINFVDIKGFTVR